MNDFIRLFLRFLISMLLLLPGVSAEAQFLLPQQGNASYYADRFHGRKMANGKLYHRDSMTCAHLRYPLGTRLLVRNRVNGREVIVTVTDRGPYTRKFVIDLSRAAARQLDIIQYGFQPVEIQPLTASKIPFKYIPPTEQPELDLGYTTDVDLGPPVWQDDSIYWARHRLSRTAVVQAFRDSLQNPLREDTTLRRAVLNSAQQQAEQPLPASDASNGKNHKRR